MNYLSFVFLLTLSQYVLSAPIIVTRVHTAEAVTTTDTYTTVTNTHTAPTVEIFVSDGVTYTFTLTDGDYTDGTTFTSIYNRDAVTSSDDVAAVATTTDAASTAVTTTLSPDNADTSVATGQTTTLENTSGNVDEATTDSTLASSPVASTSSPLDFDPTTSTTTSQITSTIASVIGTDGFVTTSDSQTTTSLTSTSTAATTTLQAPTSIGTSIATGTASNVVSSTSTTSTSTSAAATSTDTTSSASLSVPTAIVYSPYENDSSCKSYSTVYSDLTLIKSTGITKIRVYGTDCNSFSTILTASEELGITVNQGFWFTSDGVDSIDDAVTSLISWVENDSTNGWGVFDFITIGNEAVQAGYVSVSDLISKISTVKAQLQNAGYTGKVTTAEPPVTFENYPSLCTSSAIDFVGVNPHAYFDTYSSAETAGTFVKGQVAIVKAVCGDLDIMVTETGYPSAGIQNGGNIPSVANQKIAIAAILEEMDNEVTILSTYNDYWKDPGSYGIEQSFGVIQLFE